MRIAIFTNNYWPNPFGVTGSIESFRKELEKQGHTVYVFAPRAKNYVDENPHVFRYPALDFRFKKIRFPLAIPFSWKMRKVLQKLEIDIIHAQHPNLLGWQAKHWAKKKKIPLVFTWHTLYDRYAHFAPLVPSRWAAAWAIRNAVKFANAADQVVVPTKSVKKIIAAWGVQNKFIEAIPTGVEEDFWQGVDREKMRAKLNLAQDEIALLLVSRLTPEKNVQFLVRAVLEVLKEKQKPAAIDFDKVKFVLAGEGSELPKLKKLVQKAQLERRVIFVPILPRNETKNLFAAGDIFVYASTSETQGMILTEAMSQGLPIVAVAATGAKDIVGNHVTGFLVKENEQAFAQAVLKLIANSNLRAQFAEQARNVAKENYTSEVCASKMLELYKRNIKRKIG